MENKNISNWRWVYTYDYAPNEVWENWRDKIHVENWIDNEVLRVTECVRNTKGSDALVFALLTDTHFNVNGTWDDTIKCLRLLQDKIGFDSVIHLGDFTDGMVLAAVTRKYVNDMLIDLKGLNVPVYACLGNHDCNYFKNNPQRFTLKEQCDLYLDGRMPHYYIDYIGQKLRLVFLDSYDVEEKIKYGYTPECIAFLDKALYELGHDCSAIIFSHLPPLAKLQYWANELRGEKELMTVLRKHSDKILSFINGHNHADLLCNDESFPIISIANAKCEAYLERKPKGFITPNRKLGTCEQECFDIMVINTRKKEIGFIRFGSGDDKKIKDNKAVWL